MKKLFLRGGLLAALLVLAGYSVGPNYHPPAAVALPADWRWKLAEPRDDAPKGAWWEVFGDPELNRLEQMAAA